MKIAPLFIASASALETKSTAQSLLAAVGHRNVSHMEALVQGLADESVQVPAWKFDEDIRSALDTIRKLFVGNIQTALKEQHKMDQETLNCQTEQCFMGCINTYKTASGGCQAMDTECNAAKDEHEKCRAKVYKSYISMAQSCSALHCFVINWAPIVCPTEKCLCPDLATCHTKGSYDPECVAQVGNCKGEYGTWLSGMINHFRSQFDAWQTLYNTCKGEYHAFLTVDMACDATQKKFEACKCKQIACAERSCSVEFEQCETSCWKSYEDRVKETECLEKDRKIDWSATKKIECYVDILLHEYTKEELLTKCGKEDCVNVAREEDYKHCHKICLEVDHDGLWPAIHSTSLACEEQGAYATQNAHQTAWIAGHEHRAHHDQYHLGDGHYKCDANGHEVNTPHRGGGVDRVGEKRCTEHLDIDYQVPACCPCDPKPPPVCDVDFHVQHYCQFDDASHIDEIRDCCPEDCGATCFTDVILRSAMSDTMECSTEKFNQLTLSEHSHAWAYNRCPCTECTALSPSYDVRPDKYTCGSGAHTFLGGKMPAYEEVPLLGR